jgi:hypothetical protein
MREGWPELCFRHQPSDVFHKRKAQRQEQVVSELNREEGFSSMFSSKKREEFELRGVEFAES